MPRSGALILLNGKLTCAGLVRKLGARAACVICADGGARHAAALGIRPTLVIGDMDSLPRRRPPWKGTVYLCDFDEDSSDFEKALRLVGGQGVAPVWVAGAFGGRLDHALVNLRLAERYSTSIPIALIHEGLAWPAGPGRHPLDCRPGQAVSLIPFANKCRITTHGLRYKLTQETLEGSRGLSNAAVSRKVVVEVHEGAAWIVQPR